jgi:hypothetical protein
MDPLRFIALKRYWADPTRNEELNAEIAPISLKTLSFVIVLLPQTERATSYIKRP